MANLHFDLELGIATILSTGTTLVALIWPLIAGVRDGSAIALFRGSMLCATGSLMLMRTNEALSQAVPILVPDLHPALTGATITAFIVVLWIATWTAVLPKIGLRIRMSSDWRILVWTLSAVVAIYVVAMVITPVPGAISSGLKAINSDAEARAIVQTMALDDTRHANALRACRRVSEIELIIQPTPPWLSHVTEKIDRTLKRWKLALGANAEACISTLARHSLVDQQAMLDDLEPVFRRTFPRARLSELKWIPEPVATREVVVLADIGLDKYFFNGFFTPTTHLANVFSRLDLSTTFILLGEFAAALLWLLDLALRRSESDRDQDGQSRIKLFE